MPRRRLPGTPDALVFEVSVALLKGALLTSGAHSVGPHPFPDGKSLRFACHSKGRIVPTLEIEEHVEPDTYEVLRTVRRDWTAFGAAKAFVLVAGPLAVKEALVAEARRVQAFRDARSCWFREAPR